MKIAIIGTGISGLSTAFLLQPYHEITVYEKNDYLGGHSCTIEIETEGDKIPVDIGFIVFNKKNYPNLSSMFSYLNIPIAKSSMSFGVSIDDGWLEYGTERLLDIFSQPRNLIRPQFIRMILDIYRFNAFAKKYVQKNSECTIGECIAELNLGEWFTQYYLLPMSGAIWSTPSSRMLEFPADTLIEFFDNHGLLSISEQPQWYTVEGGSREYVQRLSEPFSHRVQLGRTLKSISRSTGFLTLTEDNGTQDQFDQIVLACHSDQALQLIEKPTPEEENILGNIKYQRNRVVLHEDISFMSKRKGSWSSWMYLGNRQHKDDGPISLSYWMNNLQPLKTSRPFIVTLNPAREPATELIRHDCVFEHPEFNQLAVRSQKKIDEIQGKNGLWFCGAWAGYGFHEDGITSAMSVAQALGAEIPWH